MRFSVGCFIKFFFEDAGKNVDCKVCNAIVVDDQISIVGTGSNDLFIHRSDSLDILIDDVFVASLSFCVVSDESS